MSLDRWLDKEDVVIQWNITQLFKKKGSLAIYNNMDGPRGYCSKWNGSKTHTSDFTYMQNLKNKTNEQNENRLIDTEMKWAFARDTKLGHVGEGN